MVCLQVLNSKAGIDRYSFQHYYSDIHRYP